MDARVRRLANPGFHARIFAAQPGRVERIVLHKGRIETPQAGKAAQTRHLRDAEAGVGEKLFGVEQALRLQVVQRRHPKRRVKNAPQVAVAHAQALCELPHGGHAPVPGLGRAQQAQCLSGQNARGILN